MRVLTIILFLLLSSAAGAFGQYAFKPWDTTYHAPSYIRASDFDNLPTGRIHKYRRKKVVFRYYLTNNLHFYAVYSRLHVDVSEDEEVDITETLTRHLSVNVELASDISFGLTWQFSLLNAIAGIETRRAQRNLHYIYF
jgi:hypothetical protein